MAPEQPKSPEGYPDVSGIRGIHQLRKGDVIADPQGGVDVDAIRKVAGMELAKSLVLRTGVPTDCGGCESCESGCSEAVVDSEHLIWEKPSDVDMSSPVLTVGEVVEGNEELMRLAKLSEKSRTELIADKFWDQLSPLLEEGLVTPEQMEAFLRNEKGTSFPVEIPENIGAGHVNWGGRGSEGTAQERFDDERGKWFDSVLAIVRQRVIDFMVKKWDVKACVKRWSPNYSVRNKLFDGDIPMRDGKPFKEDEHGCGASDIQRNFPKWVSETLELRVVDKAFSKSGHDLVEIYLPTFVQDYRWSSNHDKGSSHFGGFESLEVRKKEEN